MKVLTHPGHWTRAHVARDSDNCYLFGDNTEDRTRTHHVPRVTQAVIRGLRNAVGIDTKKNRGTSSCSYLSDADYEWFAEHVNRQIERAKKYVAGTGGAIVLPGNGIGTGKAHLKQKAPKCFEYLQRALSGLRSSQPSIFNT